MTTSKEIAEKFIADIEALIDYKTSSFRRNDIEGMNSPSMIHLRKEAVGNLTKILEEIRK